MPISADFEAAVQYINQNNETELPIAIRYWNNFNTLFTYSKDNFIEACRFLLDKQFSFVYRHSLLRKLIQHYDEQDPEAAKAYLQALIKNELVNLPLLQEKGLYNKQGKPIFPSNINDSINTCSNLIRQNISYGYSTLAHLYFCGSPLLG